MGLYQDHEEFGLTRWEEIHRWANHSGSVRFSGAAAFDRTLIFPVIASIGSDDVGMTCTYNLSDSVIRARSNWVNPAHRGKGIGGRMLEFCIGLWPSNFTRMVSFARQSAVPFYLKHGFQPVPGYGPETLKAGWALQVRLMSRDINMGHPGEAQCSPT
jgi:GNAT superfamily N-acetyltransferase